MRVLKGYTYLICDGYHIQTEIFNTLEEAYKQLENFCETSLTELNICVDNLEEWLKENEGKEFEAYSIGFLFRGRDDCPDVCLACAYNNANPANN